MGNTCTKASTAIPREFALGDEEAVYLDKHPEQNVTSRDISGKGLPPEQLMDHKRSYKPQKHFTSFDSIVASVPEGSKWQDNNGPKVLSGHSWKHPSELFDTFGFFIQGPDDEHPWSCNDIIQGAVGDCWFLAALSLLGNRNDLMAKLCSRRDEAKEIFEFTFWKNGQPIRVCVDGLVPVLKPASGNSVYVDIDGTPLGKHRIAYCRSDEIGELWPTLAEKAYAKLHGGYENLQGGLAAFGLADLTGCQAAFLRFDLSGPPNPRALAAKMAEYQNQGYLMATSFHTRSNAAGGAFGETSGACGLIAGHAYSVLDVRQVMGKNLVKCRNPHGKGEWKGDWGDDWNGWERHDDIREQLNWMKRNDGEFWMSISDFARESKTFGLCKTKPHNASIKPHFTDPYGVVNDDSDWGDDDDWGDSGWDDDEPVWNTYSSEGESWGDSYEPYEATESMDAEFSSAYNPDMAYWTQGPPMAF